MSMDNKQALGVLYMAARMAKLSAEEHDKVGEAAQIIQEAIEPKKTKKEK